MSKKDETDIITKDSDAIGRPQSIDYHFNEELFRIWLLGKSMTEIHSLYLGTPREFSYPTLWRAAKRYKWKERKSKLIGYADANKESTTQIIKQKAKDVVAILISISEDEIKAYLKDPVNNPKPSIIPDNMTELDKLLRLYYHMDNDGVDKKQVDVNKNIKLGIDDKTSSQVLKLLADSATKQLIGTAGDDIIDVEFMNHHSIPPEPDSVGARVEAEIRRELLLEGGPGDDDTGTND